MCYLKLLLYFTIFNFIRIITFLANMKTKMSNNFLIILSPPSINEYYNYYHFSFQLHRQIRVIRRLANTVVNAELSLVPFPAYIQSALLIRTVRVIKLVSLRNVKIHASVLAVLTLYAKLSTTNRSVLVHLVTMVKLNYNADNEPNQVCVKLRNLPKNCFSSQIIVILINHINSSTD